MSLIRAAVATNVPGGEPSGKSTTLGDQGGQTGLAAYGDDEPDCPLPLPGRFHIDHDKRGDYFTEVEENGEKRELWPGIRFPRLPIDLGDLIYRIVVGLNLGTVVPEDPTVLDYLVGTTKEMRPDWDFGALPTDPANRYGALPRRKIEQASKGDRTAGARPAKVYRSFAERRSLVRAVREVSAQREAGRLTEDQAYSELMRLFSAYQGGWSVPPHRPAESRG